MKTTNLLKASLLLSACFVSVAVVLGHEFAVKSLSSRQLGIGLILLCGLVCVGLLFMAFLARSNQKAMLRPSDARTVEDLDTVDRKKQKTTIRIGKIFVAVLALALVNGLRYIGKVPLWVLLVGITINLVLVASIVGVIIQAQRSPK